MSNILSSASVRRPCIQGSYMVVNSVEAALTVIYRENLQFLQVSTVMMWHIITRKC
jgi:hypothetical protein